MALLSEGVKTLLDSLPLAVVAVDEERRIVAANQAALELFVYRLEDLVGRQVEILLPPRLAESHAQRFQEYAFRPATRAMGHGRDLTALRSDGTEIPVEIGLTVLGHAQRVYLASVVDLTMRKRVEQMLKDQESSLESSLEKVRLSLAEQIAERSRLEERHRFARELHDTLSQTLYTIGLGLRTALGKVDKGVEVKDTLTYCFGLTEAALAEMRALLFKMRPDALEEVSLAEVLRTHAASVGSRTPFGISFEYHAEISEELELQRKYALYRIGTEAMHNCVKHAVDATSVSVVLIAGERDVTLMVKDNGNGFAEKPRGEGCGLRTMRERAEAAQGRLAITTGPGGTTVRAVIPRTVRD